MLSILPDVIIYSLFRKRTPKKCLHVLLYRCLQLFLQYYRGRGALFHNSSDFKSFISDTTYSPVPVYFLITLHFSKIHQIDPNPNFRKIPSMLNCRYFCLQQFPCIHQSCKYYIIFFGIYPSFRLSFVRTRIAF